MFSKGTKAVLLAAVAMVALPLAANAQVLSASGPGGPIPDGSGSNVPGAPLLSTATIVGAGPVVDAWIDFSGLAHSWSGDVTIRLTHPNGTTSMDIQSRPGRGSALLFGFNADYVTGNTYSFSDSGADLYASAPPAVIPSGTYRSSSNPNPPATNSLPYSYTPTSFQSTFGGLPAAGNWTLELLDWAGGDTGSMGGWTMNVLVPEPATMGLLALGLPMLLRRRKH